MPAYLDTFNKLISFGAIVLQASCLLIILVMLFAKNKENPIRLFFKKYAFYLGFSVAFGAVLISLFYSNVIGFPPCELCWIQRIFIYPQLIFFAMELYKKDKSIIDFSMVFALIGILVSIYHVYIELGGKSSLPCAAPGPDAVSCATRYVFEFSYVTIPIMSLTVSLFILLIMANYKYLSRK